MANNGWIGVDLDGTLAVYDGWQGPTHIGPPVPAMLERVKRWLAEGLEVRIFTARVSHDGTEERVMDAACARSAIVGWALLHLGCPIRVTNEKDYEMLELWDDRAVQVEENTGRPLGPSRLGHV